MYSVFEKPNNPNPTDRVETRCFFLRILDGINELKRRVQLVSSLAQPSVVVTSACSSNFNASSTLSLHRHGRTGALTPLPEIHPESRRLLPQTPHLLHPHSHHTISLPLYTALPRRGLMTAQRLL